MWAIFSRDASSSFPYELGEAAGQEDSRSVWRLHKGKKKQNGEEVSIFVCGGKEFNPGHIEAAKAAVKRLKTLRHPCILTYLDSLESDKQVQLVTEPVSPLLTWLTEDTLSPAQRTSAISWGLLQVTVAADMWGLGCLVWETFNGTLDQSINLKNTSKIPKSLVPTYTRLVGASPTSRPNPREVVSTLSQPGQFFHNDLVETLTFLDEIQIKDNNERHKFFSQLAGRLDSIPQCMAVNKVLPALLAAHEFSNAGSAVLAPLFKIGQLLGETEYQQQILPCVVRLFSSSDRATRLRLLQQASDLATHIDPATLNTQVFPHLASGFLDTNPTIRENTVKEECEETPNPGGTASEGGGGWEDAEDWSGLGLGSALSTNQHQAAAIGALESAFSSLSTATNTTTSIRPPNPQRQAPPPLGDPNSFFNSISQNTNTRGTTHHRPTAAVTTPSKPLSDLGGWDEWEQENVSATLCQVPGSSSSRGDEARLQREERRLQRQREIEAKRAARAGPMKLGAKKI
ncbi:N-terminal kinase-like protein [Portunus trituberculatus]|uniref:N-terminal kinase-like protein n=1 Tax=Portunus trituberculatus TaxID=210409 RepID=A0A5B7D127_PORTR|nr:N-terminal kinase-like protein [Portunus trituberculatus]